MSSIGRLRSNINGILSVRDRIGAALKPVRIVTQTWSGGQLGLGTLSKAFVDVLPSPRVVEFRAENRITQGGLVKSGDILLKMISKQTFPTVDLIDGTSAAQNVDRFYEVGGIKYTVLEVTEKHLYWNVLLRRRSNQGD